MATTAIERSQRGADLLGRQSDLCLRRVRVQLASRASVRLRSVRQQGGIRVLLLLPLRRRTGATGTEAVEESDEVDATLQTKRAGSPKLEVPAAALLRVSRLPEPKPGRPRTRRAP